MELNYRKIVLDYLSTEIVDEFDKGDFKVYSESTADGYEVYVATHDDQNVSINEVVSPAEPRQSSPYREIGADKLTARV